ncbi:E3 ubiquitin-protein ligase TRIM56-like isoform X2 [Apostichopus japonicus]
MAESGLVKDLHDNFLQCAICMEGYKRPRMLPCIHSFCLKCLEKFEQSLQYKPFSCPTCRATVAIPKTGLKDLPSNFLLVSLMERFNLADTTGSTSSSKCIFCNGNYNIQRCIDCNMHVCVTCKQFHDKIPDFCDHKVIPIDKFSDENYMKGILALEVPQCSEHQKEKLRFYCTTCSKLVCRDCAIVGHRGHECLEAKTRVNIAKQNLQLAIENSGKPVMSVRQISANVDAATISVEKKIEDCERKVDQQYDQVIERLNADRNKLKKELEKIKTQQCTPLKEIKNEVTNWTEAMENTQVVAKKIMAAENQWEILGMEKDITDAFKKLHDDDVALNNKHLGVQEVLSTTITFSPSVMNVSNSASQMSNQGKRNRPNNCCRTCRGIRNRTPPKFEPVSGSPVNKNLLGTVQQSSHKACTSRLCEH